MAREFFRDLKYGARQLVRERGFAAAAVISLALGIGLNTTLFSVVNGVLLRGGPVAEPDRLVEIYSGPNEEFPQLTTSYPDYLDIARGADALSAAAAYAYVRGILSNGERGVIVTGEAVTANYFDVLGVQPPLGRGFRSNEDARRGQVLRLVLWQGGRLAVLGVALGSIAALGVGRLLESLLYGVSRFDPLAYGVAASVLLLVACAANLAPALAAARLDPLRALRSE